MFVDFERDLLCIFFLFRCSHCRYSYNVVNKFHYFTRTLAEDQ